MQWTELVSVCVCGNETGCLCRSLKWTGQVTVFVETRIDVYAVNRISVWKRDWMSIQWTRLVETYLMSMQGVGLLSVCVVPRLDVYAMNRSTELCVETVHK